MYFLVTVESECSVQEGLLEAGGIERAALVLSCLLVLICLIGGNDHRVGVMNLSSLAKRLRLHSLRSLTDGS